MYQYIEFNKITDELIKKYGYKKITAEMIVNSCIKKNILKEYLTERKKEVIDIMGVLFDQDTITKNYENEIFENGRAEGIQQGILKAIVDMVKDKLLSVSDAAKRLGISEKEFMKLSKA